jgi:hypothetical protein
MFGAPYISESVQNSCMELGVGYVDLNGTLLLARGSIYVDVIRPARNQVRSLPLRPKTTRSNCSAYQLSQQSP